MPVQAHANCRRLRLRDFGLLAIRVSLVPTWPVAARALSLTITHT